MVTVVVGESVAGIPEGATDVTSEGFLVGVVGNVVGAVVRETGDVVGVTEGNSVFRTGVELGAEEIDTGATGAEIGAVTGAAAGAATGAETGAAGAGATGRPAAGPLGAAEGGGDVKKTSAAPCVKLQAVYKYVASVALGLREGRTGMRMRALSPTQHDTSLGLPPVSELLHKHAVV